MQLFLVSGAIICALTAITFAAIGSRISKANKAHYSQLREISGKNKPLKAMRGEVAADREGARDYYVAAGMAINTKNNKIVNQGKLSSDAISTIVG